MSEKAPGSILDATDAEVVGVMASERSGGDVAARLPAVVPARVEVRAVQGLPPPIRLPRVVLYPGFPDVVPGDLLGLLGGMDAAQVVLVALVSNGITTTAELLALDQEAVGFSKFEGRAKGVGGSIATRIALYLRTYHGIHWPPVVAPAGFPATAERRWALNEALGIL